MYQQPSFPQLYQQQSAQTSQSQTQPSTDYSRYSASQAQAAQVLQNFQQHQAQQAAQQQAQQAQQQQVATIPARTEEEEVVGNVGNISVTGCTHSTVGGIVRGNFTANGQNHGRPTYKKDSQVNGLDVQLYYWDERDGSSFCGWWFGPKVGGDQVWAYHPSSSAQTPPTKGWKVPYDGPVDPSFEISAAAGAAGGAAASAQTAQQQQAAAAAALQQQYAAYTQQLQQQQAAYQQHYAQQAEQLKQQQAQAAQLQAQMLAAQKQAVAMAEMKSRTEEIKARQQAEMARKAEEHQRMMEMRTKQVEEQKATMKIRQVMQKMRMSTEENLAQNHQELADIMKQELIKCGEAALKVKDECEQAVEQAQTRIQAMKLQKQKEEERRAEQEKLAKEAQEKAAGLLKELAAKVKEAEKAVEVVTTTAEPLKPEADLKLDAVNKIASAIESKVESTAEKIQECQNFVKEHSATMRVLPVKRVSKEEAENLDEPESLQAVVQKLADIVKKKEWASKMASVAQERLVRKNAAKKALDAELAKFSKFDLDKDGVLNKKELISFAKKDASVTITDAQATRILKGLGAEVPKGGGLGVKKADFHRLKIQIGVARERVKDAERRKKREARDKELEGMKDGFKEKVEAQDGKFGGLEEKVAAVETAAEPLIDTKSFPTAGELGDMLDKLEEQVQEAKEAVAEYKQEIAELKQSVEPELMGWFVMECRPLDFKTAQLEPRLVKATALLTRGRADAKNKAALEMTKLEKQVVAMLRHHQKVKKQSAEDLFGEMVGEKEALEKTDFVSFFTKCEKPEAEDGEGPLSEEEVSRVFDHLAVEETIEKDRLMALIRTFKKVLQDTVLTDGQSVKDGKSLRRLTAGEVLEILSAEEADAEVELTRVKCRALQDGMEGWVTVSGNQGTPFLQDHTGCFRVVKETILTSSFELDATAMMKDGPPRKLRHGEVVDVWIWPKKDKTGLTRLKCKCRGDGAVGWVTSVGNTGTTFLEVA